MGAHPRVGVSWSWSLGIFPSCHDDHASRAVPSRICSRGSVRLIGMSGHESGWVLRSSSTVSVLTARLRGESIERGKKTKPKSHFPYRRPHVAECIVLVLSAVGMASRLPSPIQGPPAGAG